MAENQDGQEKTEQATPKRLTDARDKGQVSKSVDVTTAGILLLGGMTLFMFGKPFMSNFQDFMKEVLRNSASISITEANIQFLFGKLMTTMAVLILPIIGIITVIAFLGEVSQVGFRIANKKFTEGLNFKQIFNPFSGMKRLFLSKNSLFELAKNLLKVIILGLVVWSVLYDKDVMLLSLMERPFFEVGRFMTDIAFEMLWKVGIVYIAIALADFYYQRWQFKDNMKMTKKEIKDENKQSEGDPHIKSRLRSQMRNRIRKLMLKNVQTADVIVTNPTHFAVALSYKSGVNSAPIVVAKGVDFLAQKIKMIGYEHDIPIVENPPLARELYKIVEVDQEIPENLFKAVAEVLAYVYSLKRNKYNF
ncbi:MAG TPA: flagellar biosynthesis protein FlhB [Candidatus Kapabacteria bacterium]|nr:flagellar biosynthesis protein FlhB [Candidatus Kapabacteria bacterium]